MTRPAAVVQPLLLLLLLWCCSGITARSLMQEDGMLLGVMGPALEANQSAATVEQPVTTAASVDIAQAVPAIYLRVVARHNVYRARHGVGNLTWDAGLAATARTWASGCQFSHNPAAGTAGFGENIYAASLGSPADLSTAAMQSVTLWYNEISKYSFSNPGFSSATGHFTQVVWKATTKVGCFAASCPGLFGWPQAALMVCDYSPPGNFGGTSDYRANVLPLRRRRAAATAAAIVNENSAAPGP